MVFYAKRTPLQYHHHQLQQEEKQLNVSRFVRPTCEQVVPTGAAFVDTLDTHLTWPFFVRVCPSAHPRAVCARSSSRTKDEGGKGLSALRDSALRPERSGRKENKPKEKQKKGAREDEGQESSKLN